MKIGLRTLKTGLAAVLSLTLAEFLHLQFAPAAAVISLLSLLPTKKKTWQLGPQRLFSFLVGSLLASSLFFLLGFHPLVFGLFLVLFIPLSATLKIQESLSVTTVLVTHYLSLKEVSLSLFFNEFLLLSIGLLFPFIFNSFMPKNRKHQEENQEVLEEMFRLTLQTFAQVLNQKERLEIITASLHSLEEYVVQFQKEAEIFQENHFLTEDSLYRDYFHMRSFQVEILKKMLPFITTTYLKTETLELQQLFFQTAATFHKDNDGKELLAQIATTKKIYQKKALPKTREEFERRANLFQIFQLLEELLLIKQEFFWKNRLN